MAREAPDLAFTTLAHHIDLDWLREAYRRTRKDGAVGVDGQSAEEYAENLEGNLQSLLDRAKSGTYRAPAVRRVRIPKGTGSSETRPIGIPTFEDKILQRAVVMVLEAVYEQDFRGCSYGFRPGRSAHQALETFWRRTMGMQGGWVLKVDIQDFFGELDHGHLRSFLRRRVRDGVLLRLIGKWLNAGVLEDGSVTRPEAGTPQGGVASPLLANIYLHEVLDTWFEDEVKPRLRGHAFAIRFADDAVLVFSREDDVRRVWEVLPKRLAKYGLTLHPQKTRLIDFRCPALPESPKGSGRGTRRIRSFDLLGFTHFWARSQKGNGVVRRKTAGKRLSRALREVSQWCRRHRHLPLAVQQKALARKLYGHFSYYGITGNSPALSTFRREVNRIWRMWLSRRSQRGRLSWERFHRLLQTYPLPQARAIHSIYARRPANP